MNTEPVVARIAAWLRSTEREVRRVGDRTGAVLRCRHDAPPVRVWAAWTDPGRLERWFARVSAEPKEGAARTFDVGAESDVTSRTLRLEPSHRLVFTWSYPGRETDEVDLRLSPDGDGTLLELEQRSHDKTAWWVGAGAGWESALFRLGLLLGGEDPRRIADDVLDRVLGSLWTEAGRVADDVVHGWAPVYPHLRYEQPDEAIACLVRAFGFRERARMARPDGTVITAILEGPAGGLVMAAGISPGFMEWIGQRVPGFREQQERPWPNLSHTTTVLVRDVDAHYERKGRRRDHRDDADGPSLGAALVRGG